MKLDYHMHFEYGSYDENWVKGFFDSAKNHGLTEIGISEHSHTFPEFKDLYYQDLILDDSFVGKFQQQWLKKNKFKYTLDDYFNFMAKLRKLGYKVKTGIEVCNFQDQEKVKSILAPYDFDYIIGSIHFLHGDMSASCSWLLWLTLLYAAFVNKHFAFVVICRFFLVI